MEGGGDAGTEVAADACSAHQADLGLDFLEEVDKDCCVGVGGIGIEASVVDSVNDVGTVGEDLRFDAGEVGANNEGFEADTEAVGEFAAFGKEFEADIGNAAFVELAVNYKIVVICHSFNDF